MNDAGGTTGYVRCTFNAKKSVAQVLHNPLKQLGFFGAGQAIQQGLRFLYGCAHSW